MGKGLNGTELGVGISQRKDGIYCARFVNRLGHCKYIYDNNLRRIKQLLKQAIKEDKEKSNLEYDYTLNQWFDFWFENYKQKEGMSKRYLESISHNYDLYARDMGNVDITNFRNVDVLRIIRKALKVSKTAGETVRHTLTQMMEKAYLNDVVTKNVCKSIEAKPRNKKIKQPLSRADEKMILNHCKNQLHKDMIEFNINTGLRLSEMLGLSFDEVDLNKKVLCIKHQISDYPDDEGNYFLKKTKTKNVRYIPLNNRALVILRRNIKMRQKQLNQQTHKRYYKQHSKVSKELIFVNTKGNCFTRAGFYSVLAYIKDRAVKDGYKYDCKNISPYTFRHTFATRCMEAGMTPNTVSTLLGHTSVRMTLHYVHNSIDQFNDDIVLIESI